MTIVVTNRRKARLVFQRKSGTLHLMPVTALLEFKAIQKHPTKQAGSYLSRSINKSSLLTSPVE